MAEAKKNKKTVNKGRVFVSTDRGAVVPFEELRKVEIKKDTKQLKQESTWLMENGLIPPPYPFGSFLTLYESNTVFMGTVNQIAQDVAGLGYALTVKEGMKENATEEAKIRKLLDRPNPDDSFRSLTERLLIDWGTTGNVGLEVVRNNKKDISELYYLPFHTMRVHKSQTKFCQLRNNKKVWFAKFGYEKQVRVSDGQEGKFPTATRANEMIHYRRFYPKSDYYGMPNILAGVGDLVALIGVRDFNLAFFQNFGIPAGLVVLEGDWEDDAQAKVTKFLEDEVKGTENAHRTLVITQPEGCKFTWKPLATEVREASFRVYQKDLKENILIAYSMPAERIGVRVVGTLGGNVAEEATKVYLQSVVEPLQEDMETIINRRIIEEGLGCAHYVFKFNNIDTRDMTAEMERQIKQIRHGIKTPNEVRNELGLKSYPEGDKYYMESSLIESGEPGMDDELYKEDLEPDED